MLKIKVAIACALLSAGASSIAQGWAKEVTSLRGVELGAAAASAYPECPKRKSAFGDYEYLWASDADWPEDMKARPCFKKVNPASWGPDMRLMQIDNLPTVTGMVDHVGIEVLNGRIGLIDGVFSVANFTLFEAAARDKYGKPTAEETKQFRDGRGVVFTGRSLRWDGVRAVLMLDEHRVGDKEFSFITLASREYLADLVKRESQQKQQIGSGL